MSSKATVTWTDLHLLLGVQPLGHRRQLELELRLRWHHKDDLLQGSRMLVAQEEHDLSLAALILCLQTYLHEVGCTVSWQPSYMPQDRGWSSKAEQSGACQIVTWCYDIFAHSCNNIKALLPHSDVSHAASEGITYDVCSGQQSMVGTALSRLSSSLCALIQYSTVAHPPCNKDDQL